MYFINTTSEKPYCGVRSFGLQVWEAIKPLGFIYTEDLFSLPKESLYIFNWHPGTNLNILNEKWLNELGGKSIGFLHDPYNNPDFFDIKARLDPTFKDQHPFYSLPRIIKDYDLPEISLDKITITSWGYGLGHKNYDYIVNKVENELEDAVIRLHIPFSSWCDPNGEQAKAIAQRCKQLIKHNHINISHDYMDTFEFIKWASQSTINVFAYADIVGGISSCVDTALMAKRPIGVNKCSMFKHIYNEYTSLEGNTFNSIISNCNGHDYLKTCHDLWTEENFRNKILYLIEKLNN